MAVNITNRADAEALIREQIVSTIFQNAPKQSVFMGMARKLPNMTSKQTRIRVLDFLPTAYWVDGDTGMKQTTRQAWDNVYLTAGELAVIVPIPESVFDDAEMDIMGEITPRVNEAIGQKVDAADSMNTHYHMTIAGCERDLPICPLNDKLSIGAFVIFGDCELTEACATELLKKAPEFDYLITAESKGIPLVYEMARQCGCKKWMLARKGVKLYMKDVIGVEVRSITTDHVQKLYIDGEDATLMKDKRILIVDDVISTGESLTALEKLVEKAGGNICGRMAILAEGDAQERGDIIYLEKLPLFNPDGTVLG